MTSTVLVVAKAPVPGRSKTRLVPPLTAEQAAELHRALLLDTLDACRAEVADVRILYADPTDAEALGALAGAGTPLVLQEGRGLADALARGIAGHVSDGPVAMVSSDTPGIPPGSLAQAFEALADGADVVLGPALDGGYWMIAMRDAHAEPFREIPWSTPAVFAVTQERCRKAGLRLALLEPWRDVDTLVDLDFLLANIEGLRAARTCALLRELDAAGTIGAPPGMRFAGSELIAGSPWRAVVTDRLLTRDGAEASYTYLATPRAVFVVPVTDDGELVFVRQYRHPVRDWTLEVPAGSVEEGEAPRQAAERELAEEVGGTARHWRHLTTFYSSSAHLSLRSDVYLATGVTLEAPNPEAGEEVTLVRVPVDEAIRRALAGELAEGQTALAVLLAAPYYA